MQEDKKCCEKCNSEERTLDNTCPVFNCECHTQNKEESPEVKSFLDDIATKMAETFKEGFQAGILSQQQRLKEKVEELRVKDRDYTKADSIADYNSALDDVLAILKEEK